jgi:DNA-binding CsgD family transcriptional regulator
MKKSRNALPLLFSFAAFTILVSAYILRVSVPSVPVWGFAYPLLLVLVVFWTVSWFVRISDAVIRRYLVAISVLLLFWIIIRVAKLIGNDPFAIRFMWYLYYVPFTMLPVFLYWIGLRIGGIDEKPCYRLLKWIPFVISAVLLIVVLTNDWTQLVFKFYNGIEFFETDYTRGWPYYVIAVRYLYLVGFFMIATIVGNKGIPLRHLAPLVVIMIATTLYGVGYALDVPLIIFREMTIVYCTLIVTFIEICLYVGIIGSRQSLLKLQEYLEQEESPAIPHEHLLFATAPLTDREKELLLLLLSGDSPKQIATKFGISRATVSFHTTNLYRKINVSSRHELMAKIIQLGPQLQKVSQQEESVSREACG